MIVQLGLLVTLHMDLGQILSNLKLTSYCVAVLSMLALTPYWPFSIGRLDIFRFFNHRACVVHCDLDHDLGCGDLAPCVGYPVYDLATSTAALHICLHGHLHKHDHALLLDLAHVDAMPCMTVSTRPWGHRPWCSQRPRLSLGCWRRDVTLWSQPWSPLSHSLVSHPSQPTQRCVACLSNGLATAVFLSRNQSARVQASVTLSATVMSLKNVLSSVETQGLEYRLKGEVRAVDM